MSNADRIRMTFEDFNSKQAVNVVYMEHDADPIDINAFALTVLLLTETNIAMTRQDRSINGPDFYAGAEGPYGTCQDMVTALFEAADGSSWPVTFPGPVDSIFLADDQTLDPSDPAVADFIVNALVYLFTKDLSPLVEYKRGWRWYLDVP